MVSKKDTLIEETNKVISEYTTRLTIRQIFYRLVSKHIIANTVREYGYLDKVLVDARWDGRVKFLSIEDRTRQFIGEDEELHTPEETFQGWLTAFLNCYKYHKLPMWLDQEKYVEVWLEKQALQGLFDEITRRYNVTLFPCRGYPSLTKLYESAIRISDKEEGKDVLILYFGDFDPSGEDIPRKIQEDLERLGRSFEMRKIAITKEQIEEYNIPPLPAKTSDPRYASFVETHGDEAVELDAIDPKVLQDLIREALEEEFDQGIREEVISREEEEQEQVKKMIEEALKKRKKEKKE